ncbi:CBS domain-containing protein [Herbidospora mongoliensis]|uniref:CBS domain-containing protein n=1 Tax=Herbidospora mongoliensis TaxID=688067 RepID=UPI0008300E35|nr:CBS domain-containing protein [Herbidospora mongoliensis]
MTSLNTLTARDVMTRVVVTVAPDESPLMAWELMRRAGVHHIPIISAGQHLHGLLSTQDLADNCTGTLADLSRRQVGDLVKTERTPRVGLDRSLGTVAETMLDSARNAVPVVDEHGRVVGVITAVDVLRAVAGRISPESRHEPSAVHPALFRLQPVL